MDATLGVGNTSDLGMSVGVVTATQIRVGATTFTEDLVVQGNARVTGILTIGTASITVDGDLSPKSRCLYDRLRCKLNSL